VGKKRQRFKQKKEREIKRLRPERIEEYNRLRRNALSKVNRIKKETGVDLKSEIALPRIKEVKTYEELERLQDQFKNFTRRNNNEYQIVKNQYNVKATRKQLNEINQKTKKAQENADKRIEELNMKEKPYFVDGKEITGGLQQRLLVSGKPEDRTGIYRPEDFDFSQIRNQEDLENRAKNMEKRLEPDYYNRREEKMKENLLFIISQTFNSDADHLVKVMELIPASDLYEMYLLFDEFSFEYYDSEGQDWAHDLDNLKAMEGYVDEYFRGEVDFLLKGFPSSKGW
jgi:hypothetical protein